MIAGLAMAAIGALTFGAWWRTTRTQPDDGPRPSLTRLTSDVGWTDYPAISLDGRFLAYASDRSGDDNLDIWVQQIPDGPPVRLTRHAADEVEPSFSADGSRIAFQSSRLGGGIYVIPTLGGEERLLAARGFSPRFSPDGNWIAYGVAEQAGSRIYVAPAAGGPAISVASRFLSGSGTRLVTRRPTSAVLGAAPARRAAREQHRLVRGGDPRRVARTDGGARGVCSERGFRRFRDCRSPDAWVRAGNRVLFHGSVGDSSNMWQVAISPETWRVTGAPQRATFGTTDEAAASVASDGRMVFISRTMGADIWSLPIDANRGRLAGSADTSDRGRRR